MYALSTESILVEAMVMYLSDYRLRLLLKEFNQAIEFPPYTGVWEGGPFSVPNPTRKSPGYLQSLHLTTNGVRRRRTAHSLLTGRRCSRRPPR